MNFSSRCSYSVQLKGSNSVSVLEMQGRTWSTELFPFTCLLGIHLSHDYKFTTASQTFKTINFLLSQNSKTKSKGLLIY